MNYSKKIWIMLIAFSVGVYYFTYLINSEQSTTDLYVMQSDYEIQETTSAVYPFRDFCAKERYLTVKRGGDFGNLVWEYMSLYVVWKQRGKYFVPFIDSGIKEVIETTFQKLTIPAPTRNQLDCFKHSDVKTIKISEEINLTPGLNYSIQLDTYSARYEEVIKYGIHNLKQEMRFQKKRLDQVMKKMSTIKKYFNAENQNVTFVGVHYRGTDYIYFLERLYNISFNSYSLYKYYVKAMTFFKVKYENVIFVMMSIDYEWLRLYSPFLRSRFNMTINPNGESRENDFALLAHCNHSILNYGTFGATAALFAQGTTFVYDLKVPLDHRGSTVAMGIAELIPNWYKLS